MGGQGLEEVEASQVWTIWKGFMEELAFREVSLHELVRLTFGDLLVRTHSRQSTKQEQRYRNGKEKTPSRKGIASGLISPETVEMSIRFYLMAVCCKGSSGTDSSSSASGGF